MAISATLTNNSTIGLLLWAKQKRRSRFLALSSNFGLPNINILAKRRFQRRTRRSHWIRPGRTDLWWRNMIEDRCLPEEWRKKFRMSKENFMELVDELEPYIAPSPRSPRPALSAAKKVKTGDQLNDVFTKI